MGESARRHHRRSRSRNRSEDDDRGHTRRHSRKDRSRSRSRDRGRRRHDSETRHDGRHRRGSPTPDLDSRERVRKPLGGAVLATEPPAVGSIHRATVQNVRPFGVFVRPDGHPQDALVHANQVSEQVSFSREDDDADKMKALEYFCPKGSQVFVKILDVSDDGSGRVKVGCSMKVADQETGADLDPDNVATARPARRGGGGFGGPESDEPPAVGSVHDAIVERVQPYGIFVRLQGFRKFGLVHSSQVSDHLELGREDSDEQKTEALASVVAVGEAVKVKVVEVAHDERGPKVGCSIKLVNQRDGTDLDPNSLRYRPRGEGGPGGGPRGAIGSNVGAVTGGANIEWGHLAGDNVQLPDSGAYNLVDEFEGEVLPPPPPRNQGGASEALAPGPPTEWGGVASVDEALAILAKHGSKKSKKDKKQKKDKKDKKEKKEKHKKGKHKH